MSYEIKTEVFEGPMDLLIHLIKKNEVDISDIPIGKITQQYMDYLYSLEQLDLEIASSFIVMAATLISIKVKMLLPQKKLQKDDEKAEEEIEEDPRAELVRRLIEYRKFKEAAKNLEGKEYERSFVYVCKSSSLEINRKYITTKNKDGLEAVHLHQAYLHLWESVVSNNEAVVIYREEIPVQEKIEEILHLLFTAEKKLSYSKLIIDPQNKHEKIVTFLALLELAKGKYIHLHQDDNFFEINITKSNQEGKTSVHG